MMDSELDRRVECSKLTAQRRRTQTVLVRGTIRSPRSDEQCCRSGGFEDVGAHKSRMYGGASSCNALYVMTPILNCIRFSTGSQCRSSRRIGVTCLRLQTPPNSPTGKLRMRAATNVEHRAIVNDEQHVVDEVESSTHDTLHMCCFRSRRSSKSTPRLRASVVGLTTIPPTDNDGTVKSLLR